MKRRTMVAALAAAGLALAAQPALSQAKYQSEYRLSTVVGTAFPWGKAGERWGEIVRTKTGGRINIKMYPGASLVAGDQTREFTAIRQGVIDLAIGSTINWSPQIKQLNIFSLPFLMPDYAAIDALTGGEVGKELFRIVDKAGAVPVAWGENGFREVTNSKRELRRPEDFKGLKFRVVGSPLFLDTFTALGANPTQMSWADAQPALASGAVDGQENPLTIFIAVKMHNFGQKNVTLWGYVADPLIFVVNKEVWAGWSKEDQNIVRQAALEAGKYCVELARDGLTGANPALHKTIESSGVKIVTLSPAERAAFQKATRPVYEKWAKQIGPELVKKAEASVAARKK